MSSMKDVQIEGAAEVKDLAITGDWAWARSHLSVTMTMPDGKEIKRSGYVLSILARAEPPTS